MTNGENLDKSKLKGDGGRARPWVELRSARYETFLYKKMIRIASPDARPGDVVSVYDRDGRRFGSGLYNPKSLLALRMLSFDERAIDEAFWRGAIEQAVRLRRVLLRLDDVTSACRMIHAEGDFLSGLVADRYNDVLSIAAYSLGIWRRIEELMPLMLQATGCRHWLAEVDERVQRQEGFAAGPMRSPELPGKVDVAEQGVRFRVQFDSGHKTGFFCDQRDNRRRLATMVRGARVLDLCCYTGGFGLYAAKLGGAKEVTCIDLDEKAVALARKNADLNGVRIDAAQADAFAYMRQMQENRRQFEAVVLDPPKLVFGREDIDDGRRKYRDLNRLAAGLVSPGGLFVTCSCSGAMGREEFVGLALSAARQSGRSCQILDVTGAAADHPVSPACPESEYLKAVWLRVL